VTRPDNASVPEDLPLDQRQRIFWQRRYAVLDALYSLGYSQRDRVIADTLEELKLTATDEPQS
jgi:hypothetical protein